MALGLIFHLKDWRLNCEWIIDSRSGSSEITCKAIAVIQARGMEGLDQCDISVREIVRFGVYFERGANIIF